MDDCQRIAGGSSVIEAQSEKSTDLELIKIDGLPAFTTTVRELLGTTVGTLVFAAFLFSYLVIKVPQIPLFQWLIGLKASRLKWLTDHSTCMTDEVFCKAVVEDIRDAMIFEKATGIYAEKNWRKGLVELHDQTGVSWLTMKRARKFMSLELNGKVSLRGLTVGDRVEAWLNAAMAWVFLAMATLTFITLILIAPKLSIILTGIFLIIILFGCAIGAAVQNSPKYALTLINKKLAAAQAATNSAS